MLLVICPFLLDYLILVYTVIHCIDLQSFLSLETSLVRKEKKVEFSYFHKCQEDNFLWPGIIYIQHQV
jgi:hypothetical protein